MGYYKKVVQNIWGTSGALKKVRRAFRFFDDFTGADNSSPNSAKWDFGDGAKILNNKLRLNISNGIQPWCRAKTYFTDFDCTVDFSLSTYPSTASWLFRIVLDIDSNWSICWGRTYDPAFYNNAIRSVITLNGVLTQPAGASFSGGTGQLRMRRVGTNVYLYYRTDSSQNWTLHQTVAGVTTAQGRIFMQGYTYVNFPNIIGDFDNFTVI